MQKKSLVFIVFWSLAFGLWSLVSADNVPGQIIVRFHPGVIQIPKGLRIAAVEAVSVRPASLQALNAKHGVIKYKQLYTDTLEIRPDWTHLENQYVLSFPEEREVEKVVREYAQDSNVISASPVSIVHAFETIPNDTYFANQYGLTNIKASQAWDRTTGSSSTLIAVLDTGINYDHEDLDGKVNLTDGKDYVNDDNDPWDDNSYKEMYHGTTVSGVIAAASNNGKGVAGVDWEAKILPVKVLDYKGDGVMSDILEGIAWATAKGADIINMSFGQYTPNSDLEERCEEAYDEGVVLVAAAGNGNVNDPSYPAYYSNVVAVAAVDEDDKRSVWTGTDPVTGKTQASNYGDWVDIAAPGTSIWTTHKNNDYKTSSGTSLACPFVAGLAGLIKAANPGMSNQQIIQKIIDTADNIDSLQEEAYQGKLGSGRINAYRAAAGLVGAITSPESGSYVSGTLSIYGSANGWDFLSYSLEALKDGVFVATLENSSSSVESSLLGTWNTQNLNGEYTLRLRVLSNYLGSTEATVNLYLDNTAPQAALSYPSAGATVGGSLTIIGSAQDQYLDSYALEYGKGTLPPSFETIKRAYVSVESGVLGTWETSGLDGTYTLRLTAYDRVGVSSRESISLTIQTTTPPSKQAQPQAGLPLTYALPNPFDRTAASGVTFNYTLEGNFLAKIYLFDLAGNLIWQNSYEAGENGGKAGGNNPSWDGVDLFGASVSNGVYLYQVVADQRIIAKGKVIILN